MKTPLLIFSLLLTCIVASAGNGSTSNIWGKVIDRQTQKPIYGVNVSLQNNPLGLGTITNEQGEFRLWNIPVDTYKILFSCDGYQSFVLDLSSVLKNQDKDEMTVIYLNEKSAIPGNLQLGNSKTASVPLPNK